MARIKGKQIAPNSITQDRLAPNIQQILSIPNDTAATPNTLVMRDTLGDIYANTVNANRMTGAAATADQLTVARTINLNGKVLGSASFDGSNDITINTTVNLVAADISDFNTAVQNNRLDQLAPPTAALDLNNQLITNLAYPTNPTDAASKAYVDAVQLGLDFKESARAATTTNITLTSAPSSIDGVTLNSGDRVLVKDQTNAAENGIYIFNGTGSAMTRSPDADSSSNVSAGMFVFIEEGNTNGDTAWVLATDNPITVDTTPLNFVQFSGAGQITAGAGLSKTGSQIDVNVYSGTGAGLGQTTISNDAVAVKLGSGANEAAAGNHTHDTSSLNDTSWNNLSLFTGNELIYFDGLMWSADQPSNIFTGAISPVIMTNLTINRALVSDGSGKISASAVTATELGYLSGVTANIQTQLNNRAQKYASDIGDGVATTFNITHNLGTTDVTVCIYDNTTLEQIFTDVLLVDSNTVSISFSQAPSINNYRVVITG